MRLLEIYRSRWGLIRVSILGSSRRGLFDVAYPFKVESAEFPFHSFAGLNQTQVLQLNPVAS